MTTIQVKGKDYAFSPGMAAIDYMFFSEGLNKRMADISEIGNLTAGQMLDLIHISLRIGCKRAGIEFDLTKEDLIEASMLGEISIMELSQEFGSAVEQENKVGKTKGPHSP